jgi:DNA helicase-4
LSKQHFCYKWSILTSNQINILLDALIGDWDTTELGDLEFLGGLLKKIIANPNNPELSLRTQQAGNILKKGITDALWQDLALLVKRRPSFQEKCRLQNLPKNLQRVQKGPAELDALVAEIDRIERERLEIQKAVNEAGRNALAIQELKQLIERAFDKDFIKADEIFMLLPNSNYLSRVDYETLKIDFVKVWVQRELQIDLDNDQAKAIAFTHGNLKITARAGSGKTRTLVARAAFLVRHCRVPHESILLLAFNKKAALEIKSRLKQFLGETIPHVMTFHALAYALVHPDEKMMFDNTNTNNLTLSREIQKLIDIKIRKTNLIEQIRNLMMQYFRGTWDSIFGSSFNEEKLAELNFARSLQYETLNGEFVKSRGEKLIANILFENNIDYIYEKSFKWDGINYRPDFSINLSVNAGVVIEYFGFVGDPEYDVGSNKKRDFWSTKPDWHLVERFPEDIRKQGENFEKLLIAEIQSFGVETRKLTDEEVWSQLKDRAIDKFTVAIKSFILRCRNLGLNDLELSTLIQSHDFKTRYEREFVNIGAEIYAEYLKLLKSESLEDFDGLLIRAISALNTGTTLFARDKGEENGDLAKIRYALVDEFQDFSTLFYQMLSGIQKNSPKIEFFCVGDDWQAINSFAGSDLSYFRNFNNFFLDSTEQHIATNYRSASEIVEIGNLLMSEFGNGAQAHNLQSGKVLIAYIDDFRPNSFESNEHPNDEVTPLLLRIVHKLLQTHNNLTLLARANRIPYRVNYGQTIAKTNDALVKFLEHICKYLSETDRERISISTTHSFKGLESDAVIILDANNNSYPLIHPTWEFLRVFGVSQEAICDEERRLFYVALTRAVSSVIILCDSERQSPFLTPEFLNNVSELNFFDFPAVVSGDNNSFELAVFKSYSIKDELKGIGFKFDLKRKCWFKHILNAEWSIDYLNSQSWNNGSFPIEVKSNLGELIYSNYLN